MVEVKDINLVAKWFLQNSVITHKKLQKLLYFAYGIYLYRYNENEDNIKNRLFENRFEAWVHGPVDPILYEIYKKYNINLIHIEEPTTFSFSEDVFKVLNETMDLYGDLSPDELEGLTHRQVPWQKAREGLFISEPSDKPLDDKDIYLTFKEILG